MLLSTHHKSPKALEVVVDDALEGHLEVDWESPTTEEIREHGNSDDATEYAAYGIALIASEAFLGLVTIRRSQRRSGCDYWLIPAGAEVGPDQSEDFDRPDIVLEEISGIDQDTPGKLRTRLAQKVKQARQFERERRAVGVVVGFLGAKVQVARA